MPNQFNSASEGDLEQYFATDYWLIEQYIGNELWVWGENDGGILGDGDRAGNLNRSTPVTTFTGGTNWKQIAIGNIFTAAIKTDGTLWTWGNGANGRLGNAVTTNVSTPVTTFAGGTDWKLVSSGGSVCAAIKTDGTLWTWGNSAVGTLGNGTISSNISTPVTTFAGGNDWNTIHISSNNAIAVKTDGTLWMWGAADGGNLGNNNPYFSLCSTPVTTFVGGTNWKKGVVGLNAAMALKTDGTLWTWGNGSVGELGKLSAFSNDISTPITTFAGGTNWADTAGGLPEELYTISGGGSNFSAAVKTDGTLWVWGSGNVGVLGNATTGVVSTPVTTFAGGTDWKQLSCLSNHVAAIKTDGTLWTWGNCALGRLGNGVTTGNVSTPVTTFIGGTNWKQVSVGESHTAAIKTDGTLWTWGNDSRFDPFGTGTTSTPVTLFTGGTTWKYVNCGSESTAAIKTDGTLWTWGAPASLSLGRTTAQITPVTTFAGGTNWADTATTNPEDLYTLGGYYVSFAIKTDGTLWGWGGGTDGKLGNAANGNRFTPVTTFAGGTNWKSIGINKGLFHQCAAIKTDGTLWIWGFAGNALGNAATAGNRSTPITTFAGGTNWKNVDCGVANVGAIKTDGTLWMWGDGGNGVLGNAQVASARSTPITTFAGGTNWRQISIGSPSAQFMGAVKTDGTLWMWGVTTQARLGNTVSSFTNVSTPVTTFAGGTDWKQISCGYNNVLAVKTDGTLWGWGNTNAGALGNSISGVTSVSTPITTFTGGTNWKQASCGSCSAAVKTDGTLWVWGNNSVGMLGTNDTINRSTPVTTFAGGTNWKQVSVGAEHVMALSDDGVNKRLYVWGNNIGESRLGNPRPGQEQQAIDSATTWKQVDLGTTNAAAIKTDGTLWTWGNNTIFQLGIGDDLSLKTTPVTTFAGGTDWKQTCTSGSHIAAIKTDGTLWLWGSGSSGRLGNGQTSTNRSTPVTTFIGGTNWKQVFTANHTIAISDDGVNKRLYVFGTNNTRELGSYTAADNVVPNTTFAGGTNWKEICPGHSTFGGIKKDGTLWVWGNRVSAAANLLGDGGASSASISTPITTFIGGNNWKNARFTSATAIAIKTDGTLLTWGNTASGQLGNASTSITAHVSTPITTFAGGNDWKQIAAESGTQATLGAVKYGTQADLPL